MFNTRLRSTRLLRKLTQQNMADALNISLNGYQKYEQITKQSHTIFLITKESMLRESTI